MAALLLVFSACSGSGGEAPIVNNDGGTSLVATFTSDRPTPDSQDVRMESGSGLGDQRTIDVQIVDTQNVYAAGFELTYDPSLASYIGYSAGTFLEQGGQTVSYTVSEPVPGRVLVSASRIGAIPGTGTTGTLPLIRLTFRAEDAGASMFQFELPFLVDENLTDLTGIEWFGGTFTAN